YRSLRDRDIDLLLGRVVPPIQDDISVETLFHDRIRIVAGPQNTWAQRRKVDLTDLADQSWCLPPLDTLIGTLIADAFRARNMQFPPPGVVWATASHMCAVLPRGPYLGTLPASLLRFGVNLPRLKVLPVKMSIPPWPVGEMHLKNRTLTPVVKFFMDVARD